MFTNINHFADMDGDIEVINLPETDSMGLSKDNHISKVGQVSSYWGDLSKYTDEDFDHLMPRLIVPSRVEFSKKSDNTQANPLVKMVIQNISNLPMTYCVQGYHVPGKTQTRLDVSNIEQSNQIHNGENIRVTKPGPGWIPPKSSAILNIPIDVDEDNNEWLAGLKKFVLYAAPIFREKHAQKENLELFWKGFDSECFPKIHAEEHVFIIRISGAWKMSDDKTHKSLCAKPPKDFQNNQEQISQEESNALWMAGEDPQEYMSALELRVRELNRVMKRTEVEARAKQAKEREMWLIVILYLTIIIISLVVGLVISKYSKDDDDY